MHGTQLTKAAAVLLLACMIAPARTNAEADGPDQWVVTGVASNDVLNIRAEPNASSRILGTVPPNGRGLVNLGCTGIPDFALWQSMSEAERHRAAANRWCRIRYQNVVGWVRGKFLAEGG